MAGRQTKVNLKKREKQVYKAFRNLEDTNKRVADSLKTYPIFIPPYLYVVGGSDASRTAN